MTNMKNDPTKAGQLAARKESFGESRRYAFAPVYSRFGGLSYFVWDAETPDAKGEPSIIRQFGSKEELEGFIDEKDIEAEAIQDAGYDLGLVPFTE